MLTLLEVMLIMLLIGVRNLSKYKLPKNTLRRNIGVIRSFPCGSKIKFTRFHAMLHYDSTKHTQSSQIAWRDEGIKNWLKLVRNACCKDFIGQAGQFKPYLNNDGNRCGGLCKVRDFVRRNLHSIAWARKFWMHCSLLTSICVNFSGPGKRRQNTTSWCVGYLLSWIFFRALVKFYQSQQHGPGVEEVKPDFVVIRAVSGQHFMLLQSRLMIMLCWKLVNTVIGF